MSTYNKIVEQLTKQESRYSGIIQPPTITPIPSAAVGTLSAVQQTLAYTEQNLASEFYKKLAEYVIEFEEGLSEDEEVSIKLVSFGETMIIHVENIGYYNPSLISFVGSLQSGERVNLIQHVTQLSFLLIATKASKPVEERQRVGFKLKHELENVDAHKSAEGE